MSSNLTLGFTPFNGLDVSSWGISSFGRTLDLHSRGEEFDSPILHNFWDVSSVGSERMPVTHEVVGSSPIRPAILKEREREI